MRHQHSKIGPEAADRIRFMTSKSQYVTNTGTIVKERKKQRKNRDKKNSRKKREE